MLNEDKLMAWRLVKTDDAILNNELNFKDKSLLDNFKENLEFGTAGIRGIMGAGTNKMNVHTVALAAFAYAKFLNKNKKTSNKVIIGHDNRHNSKLFSEVTAKVLEHNGIKVFLMPNNELQPTPLISYTIRKMKLSGGVVITASHNPKEYNGFKVYNSEGAQLLPKDTEKIQDIMKNYDPLEIKHSPIKFNYIKESLIGDYINDSIKSVNVYPATSNIKIAFSPLHGTSAKIIPKALDKMGIENYSVASQMTPDGDFSKTKSTNPEESHAYDKVLSLARSKKVDLAIITDPDADRFGAVVKYQRRYKYLNGNQIAALYLNYKLTRMKSEGKIPKDGYIIKSVVSGDLVPRIAEKFGIRVLETHVGFKNIAELINTTKGTFLLGYEESYGFLIDGSLSRDKDSLQATIAVVEMADYFKSQNSDPYSKLKELFKEFGIHRSSQFSKKIKPKDTKNIMNHILELKKIGNIKVKEIQNFKKGYKNFEKTDLVKVVMDNGSWFAVRPSGTEPKVKFYIQTVGKKNQELMDIVIFEKQVSNYISDISEVFENKNFSWKVMIKYAIFLLIMGLIIWFTFTTIYDSAKSSDRSTTSIASILFESKTRSIFLIWVLATIIGLVLTSIQRKRLISYHGQKVKMRHVMVSSIMGAFVSWVTPFTIGGDAIGYWYLRRKGFKRGALISSYMTSTLIWQFSMIIITAILVPLGFVMYKDQLINGDVHMKAVLIIFITGISWDVFATFMIGMLTFNRRFQEWIVRTSIKLLEWIPFVHIQDPGLMAAGPQYEFRQMRSGMKLLFSNKKLMLEAMSYRLIGKFFVISAFVPIALSIMNPGLEYGDYFSQVVVEDFIRAANGMSITPGGSGTGEYISINLRSSLWQNGANGLTSKDTSVGLDMLRKFVAQWPYLLLSILTIGIIITGEKRKDIHKKKNIIRTISKNGESHSRSRFYLHIAPLWVALITVYFLVFYLI